MISLLIFENNFILQQDFYSNGKLLLSGEYLVLKGAEAIALPLKLGQDLRINSVPTELSPILEWKSYENEFLWFEMRANLNDLSLIESTDLLIAERLLNILKEAKKINEDFLTTTKKVTVSALLNFDRSFGFGSSSTLISNIAEWANIGPYALLEKTFGGSGYDIACAKSNGPIIFSLHNQLPKIKPIVFKPDFSSNLYFIYLGNKQSSAKAIKDFKKSDQNKAEVQEITEISRQLIKVSSLLEFQELIVEHESILSKILEKPILKHRFTDFEGEMKSLGAWGGDFMLAASKMSFEEAKKYFQQKGLTIIFKYEDLIK